MALLHGGQRYSNIRPYPVVINSRHQKGVYDLRRFINNANPASGQVETLGFGAITPDCMLSERNCWCQQGPGKIAQGNSNHLHRMRSARLPISVIKGGWLRLWKQSWKYQYTHNDKFENPACAQQATAEASPIL